MAQPVGTLALDIGRRRLHNPRRNISPGRSHSKLPACGGLSRRFHTHGQSHDLHVYVYDRLWCGFLSGLPGTGQPGQLRQSRPIVK
jgi:hypothetical protein